MHRNIAAGAVVLSVIAGVGLGFALQSSADSSARAEERPDSSASPNTPVDEDPTPEPEEETASGPKDATVGTLVPGRLGAITVGMPIEDAIETGWIERDTEREDVCEGTFYRWIDHPETQGLDVIEADGLVSAVGAFEDATVLTGEGLGIGSTYDEVTGAFDTWVEDVNDYGQSVLLVERSGRWLGFLFGDDPDNLTGDSPVVFMEATDGNPPGLLRDGC